MPRSLAYTLAWSKEHHHYQLLVFGQPEQCFHVGDEAAFSRWVTEHTAFAFVGQSGRLSVIQEARERGSGYWYAYRTQARHTRKRYLGRSVQVTLARLEQVAQELSSSPASPNSARTHPEQQHLPPVTLLTSKLSPPRLPPSLVRRSRLLDELEAIARHPLTLVSASAGSGKTTLLAAWVASSSSWRVQGNHTARESVIAWLSLEELDNDPIRFWSSVIAALQTCLPTLGEMALAMLSARETPPFTSILLAVLNEMAFLDHDVILILDDYHLISDQNIHEGILFYLDHAPAPLHLVLSSRIDPALPLSRLRVRGQILEIRDQELRFTLEEAGSFLTQGMGLPLSEEDVATLHQRTEGWIAGLQLAALSLSKRPDFSTFVNDFAGSHRFVLDYVQQDILTGLSVLLQDFLLETSILTGMNAVLCQAVTAGQTPQACQHVLEELERANLFVVPLDDHRQWYRYHDLFREALLARLQASQPDLIPLLHLRAARWYEQQGEWRVAIAHALAAADYPYAASLMEKAAPSFWLRGEVRTVHLWTLSLPDAVLRSHVRLVLSATLRFIDSVNLSNITLHIAMSAQVEHTFTHLEKLLHEKQSWALSEGEEACIRRRLSLLRAWIELRAIGKRGDIERLRQLSQELDALPEDEEASWEIIPLSFAYWLALLRPRASPTLIPRLREAAQRMMAERDYQMTIRLKTMLAIISVLNAQLHQAQQQCLEGVTLLQQANGRTSWEGHLYYSLFSVSYACNRLEEASNWLLRMNQMAQDWQQVELLVRGQIYAVRLALAKGDLPVARHAWQKLEPLVMQEGFALHMPWISAVRVQVWLAEGNLAEASAWAAQITFSEESRNPLRRCEMLMLVRVLLAQQQNVLAVETLERFHPYFAWPGALQTEVEWMALSVVALHRGGKREQAIQVATRLLAITEPEGYVRLDLDTGEPLMKEVLEIWLEAHPEESFQPEAVAFSRTSVVRLLTTLKQEEQAFVRVDAGLTLRQAKGPHLSRSKDQDVSREPLSRQEQQVLRLLVAGQTYAEIARTLIVSLNTVKTQISSIYRKLGVNRRAEAIVEATRLHLL